MKVPCEPQYPGFMTQIYDLGSRTQAPNTQSPTPNPSHHQPLPRSASPSPPHTYDHPQQHHHTTTSWDRHPKNLNGGWFVKVGVRFQWWHGYEIRNSCGSGSIHDGSDSNQEAAAWFKMAATTTKFKWQLQSPPRAYMCMCAFCECEFKEDIGDEIAAIKVKKIWSL